MKQYALIMIAMAIAIAIAIVQAAQEPKSDELQKKLVILRGQLTGLQETQQIITWQTSGPQAHLAIETAEAASRSLWQVDGGNRYSRVDSIRAEDLDGDGVPEIVSLWWERATDRATLRLFHWDRTNQSFIELLSSNGINLSGIHNYHIARAGETSSEATLKRIVAGGNEYEVRGSEMVRVGGEMNEAKQGESGIEVLTTISPVRPGPIREGEPDSAPYPTDLIVVTEDDGREVARFKTGEDGKFRIRLPPGRYMVKPLQQARRMPRGEEKSVTVQSGQFAKVEVRFDSGMR